MAFRLKQSSQSEYEWIENDFDCDIHILSWLEAIKKDGHLHLTDIISIDLLGTDLKEQIGSKDLKIRFDYPLTKPAVFSFAGPVTVKDFITLVAQTYERIYREENESTTIKDGRAGQTWNRNATNGKYGIRTHDLGDLSIEGFELGKDDVWTLHIGS